MAEKIMNLSKVIKMPKITLKPPKEEAKKFKSQFVKSFQSAAFGTEERISYWLDEAMENPSWDWNNTSTLRQNGETAGSPRNIIDTGELKSSKKMATKFGVTQVRYDVRYTAPYAALVHWGGYINPYGRTTSTTYLPGRPWIQLVFREDTNDGDSDAYNFLKDIKDKMTSDLGNF